MTITSTLLHLARARKSVTSPTPHAALLIHGFATISFFVFMSATQAFLLVYTYQVPGRQVGLVTGQLSLADELTGLAAMPFWGLMSDRFGRRAVVGAGYAITAASLFAMPFGTTWSPDLVLCRMTFAFGTSALSSMLLALLADLTEPQGVPRVSAAVGIASGLGAITAAFGYLGMGTSLCLRSTYATVGGICVGLGIIVVALLRHDYFEKRTNAKQTLAEVPQVGKLLKQDAHVTLSLIAGFNARAISTVVSVYISLWIVQTMSANPTLCPRASGASNATAVFCGLRDNRCTAAIARSSSVTGITNVVALVAAIIVGILTERAGHPRRAVAVAAALVIIACAAVQGTPDPTKNNVYGVACALGAAQISAVITAQSLQVSVMPDDARGALSGLFAFVGSLGVITISVLGGDLFDAGDLTAPFKVTAVVGAVTLAAALVVQLGAWRRIACCVGAYRGDGDDADDVEAGRSTESSGEVAVAAPGAAAAAAAAGQPQGAAEKVKVEAAEGR